MTEAELQSAILKLCDELELTAVHVREPRREGGDWAGFPTSSCSAPAESPTASGKPAPAYPPSRNAGGGSSAGGPFTWYGCE